MRRRGDRQSGRSHWPRPRMRRRARSRARRVARPPPYCAVSPRRRPERTKHEASARRRAPPGALLASPLSRRLAHRGGRGLQALELAAQRAAAAVLEAVDGVLGAADALGDLGRREAARRSAARSPRAGPRAACVERVAQASGALVARCPRPRCPGSGPPRTGRRDGSACGRSPRCARRAGSTPRTARRAARTCRRAVRQLREDLLRDVLGLVLVAHDRADVAVDVVGVAEVEEAERVLVALLGRSDGVEHEPLALRASARASGAGGIGRARCGLDAVGFPADCVPRTRAS